MSYTNTGLLDFCKNICNNKKTAYLLGGFGQKMTVANLSTKCSQYAYNNNRKSMLLKYVSDSRYGFDCVGLIKAYRWDWNDGKYNYDSQYDMNDQGVLNKATVKGKIASIPKIKGLAVVMDGHIGVFDGENSVYECTSSTTFSAQECGGVCKTKLSDRAWTDWCQIPFISYPKNISVGETISYNKCYTGVWGFDGSVKTNAKMTGKVIAITSYSNFDQYIACNYIVDTGSTIVFVAKDDIK